MPATATRSPWCRWLTTNRLLNQATRRRSPPSSSIVASVSFIFLNFVTFAMIFTTRPTTVACTPGDSDAIAVGAPYVSHPNGSVSSRSRIVVMPSFANRFSAAAPTSGSLATEASRVFGRNKRAIYGMFRKIIFVQRKRIELVVIAILIIGIIGYAGAGLVYAGTRVATADRTLNSVVSHQNKLNATFADINSQLGALTSNPTFKPQDAVALVDKSVANSEVASKTITQDERSLSAASQGLDDNGWLTMVGRGSLEREATRIGHARKALAAARTIAADKAVEGHFWHALYSGLADLATLNGQSTAGDPAAARSTLTTM